MMAVQLTGGTISMLISGRWQPTDVKPVLQVMDIRMVGERENERYRVQLSDGSLFQQGMLATFRNELARSQTLQKGSIVRLKEFVCNQIRGRFVIIIIELDVILKRHDVIGDPKPCPTYEPPKTVSGKDRAAIGMDDALENKDEEEMSNTSVGESQRKKKSKTIASNEEITKVVEKGFANIHNEMQKLATLITSSSPNVPSLDGIPGELRTMDFASKQIIQVCLNFANNPNHLRVWNSLDASLKPEFVKTILEASK